MKKCPNPILAGDSVRDLVSGNKAVGQRHQTLMQRISFTSFLDTLRLKISNLCPSAGKNPGTEIPPVEQDKLPSRKGAISGYPAGSPHQAVLK